MEIRCTTPIGFKGLWGSAVKHTKEIVTFNKDKAIYTLYDIVYHPFTSESAAEIEEAICKNSIGRSFSLWDKFDGQNKADMFQMNLIRLGESIEKDNKETYIKQGLKESLTEGVLDDENFYGTYSNNTYEPYGVSTMSREDIVDFANRHFDIKV